MQMGFTVAFAILSVAALGQESSAGLVIFDFTAQPGNQAFQIPTVVATHVTATNLIRGNGLTASGAANSFSSSGWSPSDADDYVEFGLTVEHGYRANLTTLKFASRSSGTGPGTMALQSSRDGFGSNLLVWNQLNTADANILADLSGLGDQTGSLHFRIVALPGPSASGGSLSGAGTWRIGTTTTPGNTNFMLLEGTVSQLANVPEPSSILLLSLSSIGLAARGLSYRSDRRRPTIGSQKVGQIH